MKWFLGVAIAAMLVGGGLAVVVRDRPAEVRRPPDPTETALRPGQTEVTGTVTLLRAEPAAATPLGLPLTVTVPNRGEGGATISGVTVGGRPASVVWDGGTPLRLAGEGGLDVSPAVCEVTPDGIKWFLDGHVMALLPGRYSVLSPVAVGSAGLATPKERVDFTAGESDAAMSTRGGATVTTPLADTVLEGPGAVRLVGQLRVRTPAGAVSMPEARFSEGAYRVQVSPGPSGVVVSALFQGGRLG